MNEPLVVDGVRYISAGEASKLVGLSRDYIARFCREGQIRARQAGRNWYVDPDSLTAYLAAREREARERRERVSAELRSVAAVHAAEVAQVAAQELAARKRANAERFASARRSGRSRRALVLFLALMLLAGIDGYMYPSAVAAASRTLHALPANLAADVESATSFLDQRLANFGNTLSYTAGAAEPVSSLASAAAPLDTNSSPTQPIATSTGSPAASPTPSSPATPTVIYQTIDQPTPRQTIIQPASDQPLAAKFDSLVNIVGSLTKLVPSFVSAQPDPVSQQIAANGNAAAPFAAESAVSQLANTNISAPAITGGSISNASFSGGSVSASGLSVSGNTSLSGSLTVGGALTAGALTFSIASTTGIITTNATETNAVITNATTTYLYASSGNILSLTATNLVATNATTTNATSTNLYAQNATVSQLAATDASLSNLSATNATTSLLFVKSALTSPNATFGALTATSTLAVLGPASFMNASTSLFSAFGPAYFGGTATSTFTSAGWLGISTSSPATTLSVSGNGYLTGGLGVGVENSVAGTLQTSGNATIGGILALAGQTTNGVLYYNGSNVTSSGNFSYSSNVVQSTGASGAGFIAANGATSTSLFADVSAGYYNPMVLGGDSVLLLHGSNPDSADTPGLVIGPWSYGYKGIRIAPSGNVGIGQANPGAPLQIGGASGNYNNVAARTNGITFGGNSNAGYINSRFDAAWDIGRDTTSGGIMNFWSDNGSTNVSAGSISVNGSTASYNTSSDRRLKTDIATSTEGLSTLLQIPVYNFAFKSDPTKTIQQGFIAQALYPIYPEAVTTNGDNGIVPLGPTSTPWEVDYGRITPLIVKSVQDIANISSTFEQNLIAWLGNAQNGITDLFAKNLHAENELCVGKSGGGEVCVTGDQLAALLSQSASAETSISVTSSVSQNSSAPLPDSVTSATSSVTKSVTSSTTPPIIEINGNNPAIVQVGSIYSDLGATITGPAQDLNLGIRTFVNGTPMSPVLIDTSAAATDTIQYVVTDQSGFTSTSTRAVIVQAAPNQVAAPANDNSPAATSTPTTNVQSATSTPANDNTASTTSATTTATQ